MRQNRPAYGQLSRYSSHAVVANCDRRGGADAGDRAVLARNRFDIKRPDPLFCIQSTHLQLPGSVVVDWRAPRSSRELQLTRIC